MPETYAIIESKLITPSSKFCLRPYYDLSNFDSRVDGLLPYDTP